MKIISLPYIIKKVIFFLHIGFIFITLFGWHFYRPLGVLIAIVGSSWDLNNSRCLLSQMEEYIFEEPIVPGRITLYSRLIIWIDIAWFILSSQLKIEKC